MTRTHHPAAPLLSLAVALGIALGGLSGCAQEEPEPKFAEQPPSADPTPEEKKETAKEFIRRWAEAERDMQNSGEAAEYRSITKACSPCQELADDMEEVYARGGWVRTEGMSITKIEPVSKNTYRAQAILAPTEYVTAQGQPEGRFDGGQRSYVITLRKKADGWQLATLLKEDS